MPSGRSKLELDNERMRELGYRTVDALVDWLGDESQPPVRRATPDEVAGRFTGHPTAAGEPFEAVLEGLFRDVLPYSSRTGHSRYFAFVPLIRNAPRMATVTARSDCKLDALDKEAFVTVVTGHCQSASALDDLVQRRLEEAKIVS